MNNRVCMGVRGGRMWSAVVAAAVVLVCAFQVRAQCEGEWLPGMGIPGVNGVVACALSWDPDGAGPGPTLVVVGGLFTRVGEVAAENIAAWDGERWHALGAGLRNVSSGGVVRALVVHNGQLVAGGTFQRSGETEVYQIAKWTGAGVDEGEWEGIGGGFQANQFGNRPVNALAVYNGELIAAGNFNRARDYPNEVLSRIARWDGERWRPLAAGLRGEVNALAVYQGELYAGGWFQFSGSMPLNRIGRWDGTQWRQVDEGVGGVDVSSVQALTVYRGKLIAGGGFRTAGTVEARRIAAWDGTTWSALGGGVDGGAVKALAVGGGRLYVGGNFPSADGVPSRYIAAWSAMTSSWSALGAGIESGTESSVGLGVDAIAVADGCVFAGGRFMNAGDTGVNGIARYCGGQWDSLGTGFNAPVLALEKYQGELVAGGSFTRAGDLSTQGIASFDGVRWRSLDGGMGPRISLGFGYGREVRALAKYRGELIATGGFDTAGGIAANKIARWNGTRWAPLGSGLTNESGFASESRGGYALAVYRGELFVAGFFDFAGGVPAQNIARWDGTRWRGIDNTRPNGTFTSLEVYRDELFVGGRNRSVGSGLRPIARWDGTGWTGVPGTRVLHGAVIPTMAVFEDRLYFGGGFSTFIWSFDGLTSEPVYSPPFTGVVRAIESIQGELFAGGGRFIDGELVEIPGAPFDVRAIAEYRGHVYFGGGGMTAGDGPSGYLARWRNSVPQLVRQPVSPGAVCVGQNISLNVRVADGYNDLQFQWRKDGEPIDAPIGTQRVLEFSPLGPTDAGAYDCVVSNECGSVTSIAAVLRLCTADYNCDGSTTGADVSAFYDLWFAGNAAADFNGDGIVDNQDVADFVAAWQGGCP